MAVDETLAVAAAGPVTLTLPLPDTDWTAATGDGIDIAGSRVITLDATANGVTRRLVLTRTSVTDPYPFARILRPGATPTPIVRPPSNPTPVVAADADGDAGPDRDAQAGVAGVASKSLKVKSNRVSVSLSCTGQTTCRGTVVLRSAVKVKKQFVTLTKSAKYTVGAGQDGRRCGSRSRARASEYVRARSSGSPWCLTSSPLRARRCRRS